MSNAVEALATEDQWLSVRFLKADMERLRALLSEAEDYITHANNWPMGTRIQRRKELLPRLRAELAK